MTEPLILVAEDNREVRQYLEERVLVPAGYRVRSVGDGMSALTLALELRPAVVISDQQMPNLTGTELTRRLRAEYPVPVILITGESSEGLMLEAIRAGVCDYLTKPFEAEQLLAAVGRALAESQRMAQLMSTKADLEDGARSLKRRLDELETLAGIGRTVTAMLEVDEVLTSVVDAAVRLTGAEEGSLLLVDEDSGQLYMRASKNFDEEFARTFRLQTQDSLAGQVLASGEPVVIDDNSPKKIKTSYLVHSLIYVPLSVRGHIIGVLGVDNRKVGHNFSQEDLTVLRAMADYAAIAIENARLFHRSEAERRKLETILRQTENGVIVVDPENRLLLMNEAAQKAFAVNGGALLGRSVVEAIDDPRLLELLRTAGDGVRREEIEATDGRIFNAQRTAIEGVGQAIVLNDVTHLKELDRIKSEFVTTVSHDLRSPLTAILGYVELIERAGEINDQQRDFIRRVQISVQHITDLVSDLLDLGRIESGVDTTQESTPISVLARYAVEGLRTSAETKDVELEARLPDGLPLVSGDPIRLRQMIGNLLENAIKYTPAGGRVEIEAESEDHQVILRVTDSGPGIPPADQPYLFDKFYRGSNVAKDSPGTGLGLSIVKSIVDHHDGRIWVESKLGEGTTFTVVLPAGRG
ncbi:MAG TPA: ATP-binding protein [Anaerolineales bacterium]|jgi:two-component system NtrC family sensor kinase